VAGYPSFSTPQVGGSYGNLPTVGPVNSTVAGSQAVSINVTVPAGAEIWFDGAKTNQTATHRLFMSPPLVPGREYAYEVQVQWKKDGREVAQTRRLTVHAGEVINLSFVSDHFQVAGMP